MMSVGLLILVYLFATRADASPVCQEKTDSTNKARSEQDDSESKQEKDDPKVTKLLRDIESESSMSVAAAKSDLIKLGVSIFGQLDRFVDSLDENKKADVRKRIAEVVDEIENNEATKDIGGSEISIEGAFALEDAIDEIEQQSATEFSYENLPPSDLELDLVDVSFWEALDVIMDQAGLKISPYGGEFGQMNLVPRNPQSADFVGRTAYSGAFRVLVKRIETARDYQDPTSDGMNVKLELNWEGHVKPIAVEQSLLDIKAIDGFKDEIPVRLPDGVADPIISQGVQPSIPVSEFFIPFELVDRKVEKIDKLTGTLQVLVPGKIQTFEFGLLSKLEAPFSIRHCRAAVTYFGANKNDDLFSLSVAMEFDEDINPLDFHRGWVLDNEIYLTDKDGKKLKPIGVEQLMLKTNQIGLNYLFEVNPEECKLTYKSATQLVKVPVKYELKGIILP